MSRGRSSREVEKQDSVKTALQKERDDLRVKASTKQPMGQALRKRLEQLEEFFNPPGGSFAAG